MTASIHRNNTQRLEPPSRRSNPFATCWIRPGALPFRFVGDLTADRLVAQLAAQNWCGEIVGPHGSGKSTLLETLKPHLAASGRNIHLTVLRDGQRRLPAGFLERASASPNALVTVDGYEQLSRFNRWRLKRRCQRTCAGLLVTSHIPTGLPVIAQLLPNLQLAQELVAVLVERVPTPIAAADVAASHACHGGNVRAILFDLYDRHETLARRARTVATATA